MRRQRKLGQCAAITLLLTIPSAAYSQVVLPLQPVRPWHIILRDQQLIFTSPLRVSKTDTRCLLPAAAGFGLLVIADSPGIENRVHSSPSMRTESARISNLGVAALAAVPGLLYWRGWHSGDDYGRTTGLLGAR